MRRFFEFAFCSRRLNFLVLYSVICCYRCIVPAITVTTPVIDYGRCFLRHPYERRVQLRNESNLPARYELLPQQVRFYMPKF